MLVFTFSHNNAYAEKWRYLPNAFEVGCVNIMNEYKIDGVSPDEFKDEGGFRGGYVSISHRWPEEYYLRAYGEVDNGKTRFETPGGDIRPDNTFTKLEFEMGYSWWPSSKTTAGAFLGASRNTWEREEPEADLDSIYIWYTINAGFLGIFEPTSYFSIGVKGVFKQAVKAEMKNRSEAESGKEKLKKKYEASFEAPMTLRLTEEYAVNVTPFYSKLILGAGEDGDTPGSELVSTGVKTGFSYLW